jgi:translation initiation factor 1
VTNKNPTVYSTDLGRICPQCEKPVDLCICKNRKVVLPQGDGIVRIQRETKGHKGKTVTLVTGLPDSKDLSTLLGSLKRLCGSGGTVKDGVMVIQGDHRQVILSELKKLGYNAKIAGG